MRSTHALSTRDLAGVGVPRQRPAVWILARLRAPWLDRHLAAGAVPWRSPTHAARALQLTGERSRRGLARALERLAERAERSAPPFLSAAVPPCAEQVLAARPAILEIAARLRSPAPVEARGVARLHALLCDAAGPCYARIHRDALTIELETVSRWLDVQD